MRLTPSPEQSQYLRAVREVLDTDEVRAETAAARSRPGTEPGLLDVYRKLGARSLLAPNWPAAYGGLGTGMAEKALLTEELIARGIPDIAHTLTIDIVGLAVLRYGTDAQRARLLPPLARGEGLAGVLFSEPDAGSDLAALRTRAVPDGDGWRLTGTKVYSAKTHLAGFALCAARTTPSDVGMHGITVFLVPLDSPGVRVSPLRAIGTDRFNRVELGGIRLTRDDVLGEADEGWQLIGEVLGLERTGVEFRAKARYWLDTALGSLTGDDAAAHADRLVALDAEVRAAGLLAWRCVNDLDAGSPDALHSATAKYAAGETARAVALAAADLCGPDALLAADDPDAPGDVLEAAVREAPGLTLASGTSEVMLTLIASGLGLPG
ncbi:putative acyl-CoA dehydrogenase FadE17 [Streptomyces sp. RB5]|uniref:Putative acyl-CoA dehydrogenase FadE17 n=1 Tax=Streptomyces smaragdinus TaxID=2585196 RepID=A0A7K0CHA1_9ACTN|nr:acyl-CoA dehydrogenase family protein [Streptomyces smaragdinus]MQY12861.1 putative acyl-CoA dehydrogenase FadE17 [Streptomyces smaragdinus]